MADCLTGTYANDDNIFHMYAPAILDMKDKPIAQAQSLTEFDK
jgi:hypothetical protein